MDIKNGSGIKKRSPKKIKIHYGLEDAYDYYLKNTPKEYHVDYKTYKKLCTDFVNIAYDIIFYESEKVNLPKKFGTLSVVKRLTTFSTKKYIPIDFKKSKELGKRVYHFNEHRNGNIYRLHWQVGDAKIIPYYFKSTRTRNRKLGEILLNRPDIEYFSALTDIDNVTY